MEKTNPPMLFDFDQMVLDQNLTNKVLLMFENEATDIESGVTSMILIAARAARIGLNLSPEKFGEMCAKLYTMAGVDDLTQLEKQVGEA
jgi:hypothetical protein